MFIDAKVADSDADAYNTLRRQWTAQLKPTEQDGIRFTSIQAAATRDSLEELFYSVRDQDLFVSLFWPRDMSIRIGEAKDYTRLNDFYMEILNELYANTRHVVVDLSVVDPITVYALNSKNPSDKKENWQDYDAKKDTFDFRCINGLWQLTYLRIAPFHSDLHHIVDSEGRRILGQEEIRGYAPKPLEIALAN